MTGDLFDMTDRIVVITGGSRGLGAQMARAFAERGARIVVASRKAESCEATAAEISDATGAEVVGMPLHVARWDDIEPFADDVEERLGPIDVLVNNAGSSPLYPSLTEISEKLFDAVIGVNMKGPFRLCALVGERMVARGTTGSIINVSSIAAREPSPHEIPYGMAKSGLDTMTAALAHAFGPHVRVNGIMPGPFLTDIAEAWDMDAFAANMAPRIPLGRAGNPDEIVGAALYLASDASSYTSGAMLTIDGGMSWGRG